MMFDEKLKHIGDENDFYVGRGLNCLLYVYEKIRH